MNNLCFGMKVLNITQRPKGNYSHPNYAMDLAGSDSGVDYWYAQGRWKCMGQWKYGSNTFFFCPVDASGLPTKVHCADGADHIVTIAMTHSNLKYVKSTVGKIYENGEPMYEEGTYGKATGNHIHLEIALGVITTKYYDSTLRVYRMKNELDPEKYFFINASFTSIKYLNGMNFKFVATNEYESEYDMKLKINCVKGAQNIRETLSFSGKKPNGKVLKTVPKGTKDIIITGFVDGIQKDGYQWVKVKYGDIEGYCQWDSMYFTIYEY